MIEKLKLQLHFPKYWKIIQKPFFIPKIAEKHAKLRGSHPKVLGKKVFLKGL